MILWLMVLFFIQTNAAADIFTSDQPDQQLTSVYKVPYHFQENNVRPMISGVLDRNKEIEGSINKLSHAAINKQMINSPLLLWEYSAPAEADTYKHFQTIAYLRYAMDQQRLKDLESNDRGDMNALVKQSLYDCVEEKFFVRHEYRDDIAGLLDSCQSTTAFKDLNYADSNVFGKLFNKFNVRGDRKDKMLAILPAWQITKDGITLNGPAKRIGMVFKENHAVYLEAVNTVLDTYKTQKTFDDQQLKGLSLPKRPFTQLEVLFLLSLNDLERTGHIEDIASQLALTQTLDQYNEASEWLHRYSDHPNVEDAYKRIIRKGIDFLEREKVSLNEEILMITSYSKTLGVMRDDAKLEQKNVLKRSKEQEQLKAMMGL